MTARAFAVTVLVLLVAGCFGGRAGPAEPVGDPRVPANTPPGCDVLRPAVAYRADGVPADAGKNGGLYPCFMRTGYETAEPTLGVSPTGTVFFGPSQPNFSTRAPVGLTRSVDEGATWEIIYPDAAGVATHQTTLDPYLWVDPETGRVFFDNLQGAVCSVFSWSDDDGESWEHSLVGCGEFDHQTVFGGPPVASTTIGYPNIVYRCAANTIALASYAFTTTCMKSLDGGRTFVLTGQPAYVPDPDMSGDGGIPGRCGGAPAHGMVDHRGWVYLPKGHCGWPYISISKDEGVTWVASRVSDIKLALDEDNIFDHEGAVGVDPDGNVYYAWIGLDRMIHLSVSRDDAASWSPPIQINRPGLRETSHLQIAVGGVGKLAVAYLGSMDSPGSPFPFDHYDNATWDGYMAVSYDALAVAPTFHSATVNPPEDPLIVGRCEPIRCQEVVDFIDIRIHPDGTPWAAFVDGCHPDVEDSCLPNRGGDGEGIVGRLWGGQSLHSA